MVRLRLRLNRGKQPISKKDSRELGNRIELFFQLPFTDPLLPPKAQSMQYVPINSVMKCGSEFAS